MLKKLIIFALVKKLLLLAILLIWGSGSARAITADDFLTLYPDADQEGNCYLLRLDDCNVIAVLNDYPSEKEIAIIFVQHKQKQKSLATAKRIAKNIYSSEVVPFTGTDGSAAILCKVSSISYKSPLSVLLYPRNTYSKTTQFIGLQGRSVRVRVDLDAVSGNTTSSSSKKSKGAVEITVNLEESLTSCAEFRVAKGRMTADDMRDFISERMHPSVSSSSSMMPSLSVKGKKDLRSLYANNEIIAYSSSYDFCIVAKGKTYRAGTLDGVKDVVRNNKRDNVAFNFPEKNHPWPGEEEPESNEPESTEDNSSSSSAIADSGDQPYTDTSHPYGKSSAFYAHPNDKLLNIEKKSAIDISELQKKFPNGEHNNACYIFKLDNSRIIAHIGYNSGDTGYGIKEVQLIIVSSTRSQSDALSTAKRLAKIISPECEAAPFAGSQPHAVIFMPGVPTLICRLYSPLNLALYPQENYKTKTRFIRWEQGMLVSQVKVDKAGAKGTVEVTFNPLVDSNYSGVKLQVIEGQVDIQHFLDYGYHMWGMAKKPDATTEAKIKAETGCKSVLSYDPSGLRYCLLYMGNNTYYCGSYKGTSAHIALPVKLKQGFTAPEIPYPATAWVWPEEQGVPGSMQDSIFTKSMQIISSKESPDRTASPINTAPASSGKPAATPQQMYKEYLEKLLKM